MTTKTTAPDPTALSAEAIAAEILTATRTINLSTRDPNFGRPSREEGHRRLAGARANIAERVDASAANIVHELATAEGAVGADTLTRYASLHALADDDRAWKRVGEMIDAPTPSDTADPWGLRTNAEHDAAKAERKRLGEEARARLVELSAEAERRRLVEVDAIEVERLQRFRAARGV